MELKNAGEPLKPNERRVPREQFGPEQEAYWGIRLDRIEDEVVINKGNETLFIDASGQILIKTAVPGQPLETGRSYNSTEEMLQAEGRWEELQLYLNRARRHLETFIARPRTDEPRLGLLADFREVGPGDTVQVRINVGGVAPEQVQIAGLVLEFDSSVLALSEVTPAGGTRVIDQDLSERSPGRSVLRLRMKRGAGSPERSPTLGTLRFKALTKGSSPLQPLSVEAVGESGKTYLEVGNKVMKPAVSEVRIRVR